MTAFMEQFGFLIIVLLLAASGAVVLITSSNSKPRTGPRPIWHYLLIWPLLLERGSRDRQMDDRWLTRRETIGWTAVVLLLVVAIVFGL